MENTPFSVARSKRSVDGAVLEQSTCACANRASRFAWRTRAIARGDLSQAQVAQSDTPRRAGGLMSWAASKAVGPLV